jgi:hypothetical protein
MILLCGVSAAALLGGLAGSAAAAQITVQATPTPFTGPANSSGSLTTSMTLPEFNSSLGTLTSVLVVAQLTSSSAAPHRGIYRWNSASSSSTTDAHPGVKSTATITGGPTQLNGAASVSVTVLGTPGTIDGSTDYFFIGSGSNSSNTTISPLTSLESPGGGSLPLTLTVTETGMPSFLTYTWPGNGPEITYQLSVTYDYSAPEPASMMILGAGLVGLGAVRRRRRKL